MQLNRANSNRTVAATLSERWTSAYGRLLALQLEPSRRYSILSVGAAEYAYTRYDQFVHALRDGWAAGLAPEYRHSAVGRDFPDAAPQLRGIDSDLSSLDPVDRIAPMHTA